jgi:ribonuclease R
MKKRRDFRALPIVTIDGETARDFDDAVIVQHLENGNFELQVHIADVAHYVTPNSALDQEARLRGTSVYFPDRAVPMLPLELSTDICSLRPQVDRLVMSCVMEIDHRGEILGYELSEGIIRSAERMTYTDVGLVLEGDAGAQERYSKLVAGFERMRDLALILNRKRERRGSIDFDLPEPVIEFDEMGLMKSITRSERNIAHRLIEEFMLSANECVASHLENKRIASLYRIHEKPDAKRVYDFELIAATFGYSLGVGPLPIQRVQLKTDRRAGHGKGRQAREIEIPKEVSEAHGEDRRQTRRAHPFLLDAAFVEAGPLFRREPGPFCVGRDCLYPLHVADPPLPGPDHSPHSEGSPARFGGSLCWGGAGRALWRIWRWKKARPADR